MCALVGNLPCFEIGNDWCVFKERLIIWLGANGITKSEDGVDRRRAILLGALSENAYKLVRELIAPNSLEKQTYEQIVSEIDKHLLPKKSLFAERHFFHSATQRSGEDFTQWAARVRQLSTDCTFGNGTEEMLRDRFILGMQQGAERDRLFMESPEGLTLGKALDIAVSISSARQAARDSAAPVPAALSRAPAGDLYRVASQSTTKNTDECQVCGYTNHSVEKCRFKKYKCSKCGQRGHLKKMCPKRHINMLQIQPADGSHEDDDGKDAIYNIRTYRGEAMKLSVEVCGKLIDFELDSGSCVTAIPFETYKQKFDNMQLLISRTVLKSYTGQVVEVVGMFQAVVKYEGTCKNIEIFVVKGGGPAVLGRDFLALFEMQISKINRCAEQKNVHYYMDKFPELFSQKLGCLKTVKIKLHLKPNSQPIFFRPRTVPFALRAKIEREIGRLVDQGVLEPVDRSDFASPTVPILKHNGDIRLCADYSVTLNKILQVEKYPLPKVGELFAKLHGGEQFSQLDLSTAYLQLCLDNDSQILTTINTHKGLFKFTRLVYGLSNAPAIFQKTMESLLQGIEGVLCLLDDVLVTGPNKEVHSNRLEQVFTRLQDAGLVLNMDKCHLFQDEVTYLGFRINKRGIHKCPSKIQAMVNAKPPCNVQELKSFLGLVNYYRVFVPHASSILCPLNNLLQKEAKWEWSQIHQDAFNKIKEELASDKVLAHYDPGCKLVLTVDASPWGLSAVLGQIEEGIERPIAYASRSLNSAERNYSQIQKEATAIIFGVRRFHQYLYGLETPFILRTDHKPLMYIFHPHKGVPEVSANRLQRYALFLTSYNYEIQYVQSAQNCADYLSRATADRAGAASDNGSMTSPPLTCAASAPIDRASYICFVADGDLPLKLDEIRAEVENDSWLQLVTRYVRLGWPNQVNEIELKPFFSCRRDLTLEQGCLMRGHKIVIPRTLRNRILTELHRSHFGVNKTKTEARALFWWPRIDSDIESWIENCPVCRQLKPAPARAPLTPWPFPPAPWYRVHLDFFGPLQGKMFLVMVDAYTKWIECFPLSSSYSSTVVIEKLQEVMSRFGIMHTLVTDNGTSFTSQQFKYFCILNGITHLTSPTYSPASNGQCEICVKIVKKHIKGLCLEGKSWPEINSRLLEFLYRHRNSKHTTTDNSPAELMFGRPLRTRFDLLKENDRHTTPSFPSADELRKLIEQKQYLQVKHYNGKRKLELNLNDTVLIKLHHVNKWVRGQIVSKIGNSMYGVFVQELNQTIKKHKNQIYKLKEELSSRTQQHTQPRVEDPGEFPYWSMLDIITPTESHHRGASNITEGTAREGEPTTRESPSEEPVNEEEEWSEANSEVQPSTLSNAADTRESASDSRTPHGGVEARATAREIPGSGLELRDIPRVDYRKYY